jgi:hypothetical protein
LGALCRNIEDKNLAIKKEKGQKRKVVELKKKKKTIPHKKFVKEIVKNRHNNLLSTTQKAFQKKKLLKYFHNDGKSCKENFLKFGLKTIPR